MHSFLNRYHTFRLSLFIVACMIQAVIPAQAAAQPRHCRAIEAIFLISPGTFKTGVQPTFEIVLKNVSDRSVRLLDVRNGRRVDLAQTYYEIVFDQKGQPLKHARRVIADPGPVAAADFFMLSPGRTVKAELTTPVDVKTLPPGPYSAEVRISFDPLSERLPPCRSTRASFTVVQ